MILVKLGSICLLSHPGINMMGAVEKIEINLQTMFRDM